VVAQATPVTREGTIFGYDTVPSEKMSLARIRFFSFQLLRRHVLKSPIGHVLREVSGSLSDVRFSPKGDRIAYFEHPLTDDLRSYAYTAYDQVSSLFVSEGRE
jgi:hypothetical protein